MKIKIAFRILSLIAGLAGVAQIAGAQQYSFSIPGVFGSTNLAGVSITGNVTFSGTTTDIFVQNNSSIPSKVTGIFLLNPLAADAVSLDAPAPSDWDLINSSSNVHNILSLGVTSTDYFGADLNPAGSSDGVDQGEFTLFTFTMGGDVTGFNPASYGDSETPHLLVRFQSVGQDGEDSAAGYGWFDDDGTITPVPEPALIAPLAVLGLGGLLYARRRVKNGKAKQA